MKAILLKDQQNSVFNMVKKIVVDNSAIYERNIFNEEIILKNKLKNGEQLQNKIKNQKEDISQKRLALVKENENLTNKILKTIEKKF
jgi:hypothetical protein